MAQDYVRHFVGENAGQLALVVRGGDQSRVHIDGSAGQRKALMFGSATNPNV